MADPERRGRRRDRAGRWAGRAAFVLAALVVVGVGLFFFLVRTQTGQRAVLEEVLKRVQTAVNGRITVDDIRGRDLREGVTLIGVGVDGPDGRPFFRADSVRATYAWGTFVSGDVVLSSLDVFGPVVFITQYHGEDGFNVDRIFRAEEEVPDSGAAPTRRIEFEEVRLHDGLVRVVFPANDDVSERAVVLRRPDGGGLLQRLVFDDIDAYLPTVRVMAPGLDGPRIEVEDLALVGQVYRDPFRVEDLEGVVSWVDSRLTVGARHLDLGESELQGTVVADFDPEGAEEGQVRLTLDATTARTVLDELQWLEPRIPSGTASGGIGMEMGPEGQRWTFSDARADIGRSTVLAQGDVRLSDAGASFEGLDLTLSPLELGLLEPWLEAELPLTGTLRGDVTMDGPPERLRARGRLTLSEPGTGGPATTADFRGIFHLGDDFAVTDVVATFDPFDYDLLTELVPAFELGGAGPVTLEASGSLDGGIRFRTDATHRDEGLPTSRVVAEGTVARSGATYRLDVTSRVMPLSFTALRRYYPDLPLSGEVRGSIRTTGPLSDLRVATDLETAAGHLALVARFDARDPGAFYQVEGSVRGFRLSELVPALPNPTVVTGEIFLRGSGLDPETADVVGRIEARDSRIGRLEVDSAALEVEVAEARLRLDTLNASLDGLELRAAGDLAMVEDAPAGEIHVAFRTDSVGRLRPLLFGDTVIAADTLTSLELELLRAEGVDTDTLQALEAVRFSGGVEGEVTLRGSIQDFSAEGTTRFEELRYGTSFVRDAELAFSATELPSLSGQLQLELRADSLGLFERRFAGAGLTLDYRQPTGSFDLFLERSGEEDYRARALFEVDTLGGRVELEELALRFDTLRWELQAPALIDWGGDAVTVQGLRIARSGPDPMVISADGTIPLGQGEAGFVLDVERLDLARLAQLLQREDMDLRGLVDLRVDVRGTAARPVVDGTVEAEALRYGDFALSRVAGDIGYADQRIALDLDAWRGELSVLNVNGTIPADLALTDVEDRFPDAPMALSVVADSLPASFVLGLVGGLEDIAGTVAGEFEIRGTVDSPEPRGTLVLQDAAASVPAVGVRYRDAVGTLTLNPDGTVDVDARAVAGGTVRVSGSAGLEPLTDPSFDLVLTFQQFQAVDRRDVQGAISGQVALRGTFTRPRVVGLRSEGMGLVVDRGTLYLEEFVRSSTVIDLSDPRYFDVIDTTLTRLRPTIEQSRNVFLDNLFVNVDLRVQRDIWLRSADMNVEISGDLIVTYDRLSNEIVLVGDLDANRGDYTIFGRRFEVVEGQVEFVGTPGINPNLGIQARTRVRRLEGEPLDILATVTGTLTTPRVDLSSPEEAIAQSDLVSYLLFGQPSYALASGQAAALEGAAGSLAQAGFSTFLGTFTNRLGTLVAREAGLDYFAISQPASLRGSLAASFGETTVEAGKYISEDLFAVLVFQPLFGFSDNCGTILCGGRLEWTPYELYTVEVFAEDRFLRSRSFGFQELGFNTSLVFGVFVVREWGY